MPFTPAHPAAVLPLKRLGLPMTALVVASMVPDGPVFLRLWGLYGATHSPVGVATVDVALTLLALGLWLAFVRPAVVDLAPEMVRGRLPRRVPWGRRQWLLAVPAAWIGAATHVAWDSFTHPGRWGTRNVAWLRESHLGLEGSVWAQYVSGGLGVLVVGLAAVLHLRGRSPCDHAALPRRRLPGATLPVVVAVAAAAGLATAVARAPDGLHAVAFSSVVNSLLALAAGIMATCAAWHLRALTAPRGGRGGRRPRG